MLMSWTAEKKRWRKTYNKTQYVVFCSELNLPEEDWTELGSYKFANEWWIAKRAEIEFAPKQLPPEILDVLSKQKNKADYLLRKGMFVEAELYKEAYENALELVKAGEYDVPDYDPLAYARLRALKVVADVDSVERLDPKSLELFLGTDALWKERFRNDKEPEQSKKIGYHLDKWYALIHARAKPTSISNIHGYYQLFKNIQFENRSVFNENMSVDEITRDKFREVFEAISAQSGQVATKKKKFSFFKSFIKYLAEEGIIAKPTNFESSYICFNTVQTEKIPPDIAEIRKFLEVLPDRLKLYVLLALNTGMNNADIGKLQHNQIDYQKRTLTKRRVKTSDNKNAPTVRYILWAETYDLIMKERASSGQFVLTANGKCLYEDEKVENNARVYDRIKVQWRAFLRKNPHLKKYLLKEFRYFSGDLLNQSLKYRSYRDPFLSHAPRSTGDRYYSSTEDVSVACTYLESVFFPEKSTMPNGTNR
jgi:integrase